MILLYHKVHPELKSEWWVTVDTFYRQMLDLQGREVVYLDDYDPANPSHVAITFDGVYQNVLEYAVPLMERFGYVFELFVTGDYVGADNAFDAPEPLAPFASLDELAEMTRRGGRIQWHTRSHPRVSEVLDISRLRHELDVPREIREIDPEGCRWFAYPHGEFSDEAVAEVRSRFVGALSCIQGDDTDPYRRNRLTVKEDVPVTNRSTSVVIATYNYGQFLPEAVESVLRQTRPPDEILISDDASTDDSVEIAEHYRENFPDLIKVNHNESNMGIVDHFNKAAALTSGDYIVFLGADNRFRSDFLERTVRALDCNPSAAIAYTDFSLFGSRSRIVYSEFVQKFSGTVRLDTHYVVHFPDFGAEAVALLEKGDNFMHGSSMYRRSAFEEVGGYARRTDSPEDFALFRRMVAAGWSAVRVPEPVLEYRQHSTDQDNVKFNSQLQLQYYRSKVAKLKESLASRDADLAKLGAKLEKFEARAQRCKDDLQRIKQRFSWHFSKPVRVVEKLLRRKQRPH